MVIFAFILPNYDNLCRKRLMNINFDVVQAVCSCKMTRVSLLFREGYETLTLKRQHKAMNKYSTFANCYNCTHVDTRY